MLPNGILIREVAAGVSALRMTTREFPDVSDSVNSRPRKSGMRIAAK